jgi:hypothetical protein
MSAFVDSSPQHARHCLMLARDRNLVDRVHLVDLVQLADAIGAALSVATPSSDSFTAGEETGRAGPDVAGQSRCFELVSPEYCSVSWVCPAIREGQVSFCASKICSGFEKTHLSGRTGDND